MHEWLVTEVSLVTSVFRSRVKLPFIFYFNAFMSIIKTVIWSLLGYVSNQFWLPWGLISGVQQYGAYSPLYWGKPFAALASHTYTTGSQCRTLPRWTTQTQQTTAEQLGRTKASRPCCHSSHHYLSLALYVFLLELLCQPPSDLTVFGHFLSNLTHWCQHDISKNTNLFTFLTRVMLFNAPPLSSG